MKKVNIKWLKSYIETDEVDDAFNYWLMHWKYM